MKERDNISTYLGKDTRFEGNLKFNGTIRIDGRFRGEILGDGTLIVGEGARIDSDIHVSQILNSGEIQGNVIADERIEVHAPGKILGNIQAPCMVIKEGAIIEGNCRMHQGEEADERKLTVDQDKLETGLSAYSGPRGASNAVDIKTLK